MRGPDFEHTNGRLLVHGRDWLSCHGGCQEIGRCHTRGESHMPTHSGFKTQRRYHQKSNTEELVAQQKGLVSSKKFRKKNKCQYYRGLCCFQTCCLRPPRRRWVVPGTSAFRFPDFRNASRTSSSPGTNCSSSSSRSPSCSTGRLTRYSPPQGQLNTL